MGSVISRKQSKTQVDINEPNTRAIFFGYNGMCCCDSAFDSSEIPTSLVSLVTFNNKSTSRLLIHFKDKSPDEIVQRNGKVSVERPSSVEEELQIQMLVSRVSRPLVSPLISRTLSTSSTETYESFEPTPLTQVLSQLYLGTQEDAEQADKLLDLGITHIISIVGGGRYRDLYPKHMYIPLRDNGSSNLLEGIENSYDFTMESQEPGNKLFVHCKLGQNRSASFVIGFLMKSRNLSLYEAYSFLKEKRELIHPHKKYMEQLRQLDLELYKVFSTPSNFLDIVLCSKEEIKIINENFSKHDSEVYKRTQISTLEDDEDSFLSLSSTPNQVRNGYALQLSTIYIPDFEYSESISIVQ